MLYQLSYTPAGAERLYRPACALARLDRRGTREVGDAMACRQMSAPLFDPIPPPLLLRAYRAGMFPMADSRDDTQVYWVEPRERAIIPLERFRCSRSLAKTIRQDRFRVTCAADFGAVIAACAAPRRDGPETWISRRIDASYRALHAAGHAHSIECWDDGRLVGGLYGVSFGRVFCGESMFSTVRDASKVALAWLVALMRRSGAVLLDCQFMTDHLASMGAVTISRDDYLRLLDWAAEAGPACSLPQAYAAVLSEAAGASEPGSAGGPPSSPGKLIAQSLTQTS